MNFESKTLRELSTGNGSYGIPASAVEKNENLYTYLRITDINDDGTLDFSGLKSVNDENAYKYLLNDNDIVFARTGNSTGRNYFYNKKHGKFVYAGFLIKFNIDSKKINPLYIKYYCLSQLYKDWIKGFNSGSTRGNINAQTYGNMPVYFPKRSQQDNLVRILSSIDDKIELNNKINANLKEQAQALFKSFYENSRKEVPFTDLVDILGGGTPKTGELSYWNGKVPFFTPKDASDLYAIITEKTITEEGLFHCNSQLYPKNTVFVTARGTVGKIALAGVPMAMNQSCYALVGKNIKQLLVYFYTSQVIKSLKNKASGSVFDAITTKDFYSEKVYVLDEIAAKEFCLYAEPVMELILQNGFQNLRLTELRDTLLPKLMSGELDVSDIELSEVSDA